MVALQFRMSCTAWHRIQGDTWKEGEIKSASGGRRTFPKPAALRLADPEQRSPAP
jgi:hypothetical protein